MRIGLIKLQSQIDKQMNHVKTQPLSQSLPQVNAVAAHWAGVLGDSRWNHIWKSDEALPCIQRFTEPPDRPVKLRLTGEGSQLLVVLDEAQWPALHVLKQISDQTRKDAIVNLWAHQALTRLSDLGFKGVRCHWAGDAQFQDTACVSVRLNGCVVNLHPESSSDRFLQGLQKILADLPLPMTKQLAQWPLASSVTLGERCISLHRIETLKVGDLVLWSASENVALRIHGAVSGATCGLVAACLLSTKELTMEEELHEDVGATQAEEENTEPLNSSYASLQVKVQIEIDGPVMTMAQAAGLAPGVVVVLPTPVDQARVRLRSQGRCFAQGELVNIGGHMGVRIIEIGGRNGQSE